jgi:hypothetical protein
MKNAGLALSRIADTAILCENMQDQHTIVCDAVNIVVIVSQKERYSSIMTLIWIPDVAPGQMKMYQQQIWRHTNEANQRKFRQCNVGIGKAKAKL